MPQRVYPLREVEERVRGLGGSLRKGGKDYVLEFGRQRTGIFVTHEGYVPDHGISQITDGIISAYLKREPRLKDDTKKISALRKEISDELKGRARPYPETVPLRDLGDALGKLFAPVSYQHHKLRVLIGNESFDVKADKHDEVHNPEFNAIAQKVASYCGTDLGDALHILPKPKRKGPGLEALLGKTVVVLAAFALFAALVWTGSTYTGASITSTGYKIGYYGIIAIIISFYALVMFFHKLHSE